MSTNEHETAPVTGTPPGTRDSEAAATVEVAEVMVAPPARGRRLAKWLRRSVFGIGLAFLRLLFAIVYFWPRVVVTIHAGQEGVLWRRFSGTGLDIVLLEGVHLIFPWDHVYVYDVRIQRVDHTVEILSTDGLEISVEVSTRYFPVMKTVPRLHQKVGPDYVTRIIIPEVVLAVREVMGKYRPQELYTRRTEEMQAQIKSRAAAQVQDRFITIDDVLIRKIVLPASVQQAIQRKLTQEQEAQEYEFRLQKETREAERKRREALGIATYQTIVSGGLKPEFLRWKGIEATLELAKSPNAKVIVIGNGEGLPLILNAETAGAVAGAAQTAPNQRP
jgi:regulator of protease activity HflC (stomatin/prohibitin superfamily)